MKKTIKINFTDFLHPQTEKSILKSNVFYHLLSMRFDLELSDNPDFLIYTCFGKNYLKYNCVRIFYTGENIRPNFNECDFAFSFDYPLTNRNYRLPLYRVLDLEMYNEFLKNKNIDVIILNKAKFCNYIYLKEVSIRNEIFGKLSKYKKIDAPGVCRNNMPSLSQGKTPLGSRKSFSWYEEKVAFMKPYKFTIAFENSTYPGYTTEKILHAMVAHTIPIYWGNPLVDMEFNTKSFINCHDYDSFDAVIERIIEIDTNDELYRQYLAEPYLVDDQELDYLHIDRILDKFEEIFANINITRCAKKTDLIWWSRWYIMKVIKASIKNFIFSAIAWLNKLAIFPFFITLKKTSFTGKSVFSVSRKLPKKT